MLVKWSHLEQFKPGYQSSLSSHNQVIYLCLLRHLKTQQVYPMQTGIPDKSDILHIFNNNIYTDFRTPTEPKCHATKH